MEFGNTYRNKYRTKHRSHHGFNEEHVGFPAVFPRVSLYKEASSRRNHSSYKRQVSTKAQMKIHVSQKQSYEPLECHFLKALSAGTGFLTAI